MKVMCVGQAAYDITLLLDHFPTENKKVRTSEKVECCGGSACTSAYLLAKWGLNVYFAGVVGDDFYGKRILSELAKIGVDTKYLQISKDYQTTSSYIITSTKNATRTIVTHRDVNIQMNDEIIDDDFDVILIDGYEEAFAKKVIERNPNAVKIIDAGSLTDSRINLSKLVDYIVCSKDFAEDYTKIKVDFNDLKTLVGIHAILERDFKGQVVITLEEKGCFVNDNGYKIIPTLKRKAVDTTGAGDIFHGAFTYSMANSYDMLKALKIANIAGALSITKVGGQYSIPTLDEVITKYNECDR